MVFFLRGILFSSFSSLLANYSKSPAYRRIAEWKGAFESVLPLGQRLLNALLFQKEVSE